MIPWFKAVLYDPNSFTNLIRGLVFVAGELPTLIDFGPVGGQAYYVGKALQAFALFMRAGDKNPPPSP